MEIEYGVFLNADGCGAGKTYAYLTHLDAATIYWEGTQELVTGPTLLVCPRTLVEKIFDECYD
jgi:hypothetical protein